MKIQRILAAVQHLSYTDPIYKWRIYPGRCPSCGVSIFISLRNDPFYTRCLRCRSNVASLSIVSVIKMHVNKDYNKSAFELSSYGATYNFCKDHFQHFTYSEYFPGKEFGSTINGICNQDVQQLTYSDNSFDIVTSNQVFEHVPNDIRGYSECYRVLRQGGALIFTVPLYDIPETRVAASIVDGKVVFHQPPEYHASRISGPKSALAFYIHSMNDICERVRSAKFSRVSLEKVNVTLFQGFPQLVVYAVK